MSSNLLRDTEWGQNIKEIQAQCSACRNGAPDPTTSGSGVQRAELSRLYFLRETLAGAQNPEQGHWEECGPWALFLLVGGKTRQAHAAASPTQLLLV